MDANHIVAIGPLSPPITGPGLKNKYIKRGLEDAGHDVTWINTLERTPATIREFLGEYRDAENILVSASTKVRLGTAFLLAPRLSDEEVNSALLPAGGSFGSELKNLPTGVKGQYLEWFGRFDCILPQSDELSGELRELFDTDVRISTLPNLRPVPEESPDFEPFDGADRPLRLAYVGRIKETKGLHYLLSAIEAVNESGGQVTVDVFGHFLEGDEYREQFLEQCESTPNAQFLGKLDNEEVIPRLREYDVFAFPTFYSGEGFPGVLVEAFAAGCLVLASDWNYNGKLVSDGHDGLLFEPESSDAIETKIQWLLEHPDRVDAYKQNSWENADNYSIETVTDELRRQLKRSGW
jgi:glycosyltransferase involved in cell wall biosynthesis